MTLWTGALLCSDSNTTATGGGKGTQHTRSYYTDTARFAQCRSRFMHERRRCKCVSVCVAVLDDIECVVVWFGFGSLVGWDLVRGVMVKRRRRKTQSRRSNNVVDSERCTNRARQTRMSCKRPFIRVVGFCFAASRRRCRWVVCVAVADLLSPSFATNYYTVSNYTKHITVKRCSVYTRKRAAPNILLRHTRNPEEETHFI